MNLLHGQSFKGKRTNVLALCLVLAGWAMGGLPVRAESGPVRLVTEGQPAAVIVLPNDADRVHREAADLLQTFVARMSGARLSVMRERELADARVVNGRIEQATADDAMVGDEGIPGEHAQDVTQTGDFILVGTGTLALQLGVTNDGLGPGGIRVKTVGNALVLLGGPTKLAGQPGSDGAGVRHAVLELLEQLGCHYLWPGESGMVVPQQASIAVTALDITYTPPIRRRGIRWGQNIGHGRFDTGLQRMGLTPQQWQEGYEKAMGDQPPVSWSTWHRLGGSMPQFGHAGGGLGADGWERYGQSHPQWFALQADGTRNQDEAGNRWRLCKSNPDLIEQVAKQIIEQVNQDPSITLVSLDSNDGGLVSWCLCEGCRALDHPDGEPVSLLIFEQVGQGRRTTMEYVSLTERMVYYWNSIAQRVTAVHPDLLFGVSAYSRYSHPPVERQVHPNLVVRYVPAGTERWQGWRDKGARQVYWRPNILLTGWHDGKLRSYVGRLAQAMAYFTDAGMVQTDINTIRHWWGVHGLNYYAAARLCWNPYLSAEQIIADYARHGFGAGAAYIEQYFHRIEQITANGVERTFTQAEDWQYNPQVVSELHSLLDAAQEAARDDPGVDRRIAFLRIALNYTELQEALAEKTWRAGQRQAVDQQRAQRLVDLNCMMLRDMVLNHNLVVAAPYQMWRSGTNAQFSRIGGRTTQPSDPAMFDRFDDPNFGMTGQEQGIEQLLAVYGL